MRRRLATHPISYSERPLNPYYTLTDDRPQLYTPKLPTGSERVGIEWFSAGKTPEELGKPQDY